MPRGSLGNRLSGGCSAFESFSWSIRLKIAIGAARGLAFLHHKKGKIIYRSLKPFDILLDSCYNAKISDFGLVRNGPPHGENSHVSTCVMGAYGYAAPEYVVTGHLYEKSDVYSFGVVLLEMLLGMPALYPNNCLSGQQNLVNWAQLHLSDRTKVSQMMDRQLEGQYSSQGADPAAQLIFQCLGPYPRIRPSMTEVVGIGTDSGLWKGGIRPSSMIHKGPFGNSTN